MKNSVLTKAMVCLFLFSWTSAALAGNDIPKAAWTRPIGQPLENPGIAKNGTDIDDGYWQGAPVGGMGAGTFSRSYRGDFSRWHIKGGVHKYETVYPNQFAMYQKSEGDSTGTAQVLMAGHPKRWRVGQLGVGPSRGRGRILCPVSQILVRLQMEQIPRSCCAGTIFSCAAEQLPRIQLPGRGLPLARGQSDRPRGDCLGASFLGQHGWLFRTFTRDFNGTPNQGNYDQYVKEAAGSAGTMKGIVFDRGRDGESLNEWDGRFAGFSPGNARR